MNFSKSMNSVDFHPDPDVQERASRGITENEYTVRKGLGDYARLLKNVNTQEPLVNNDHVCERWLYSIYYRVGSKVKFKDLKENHFLAVSADEVRKHLPEIDLRVFYNFDLESLKLTSKGGQSIVIVRA